MSATITVVCPNCKNNMRASAEHIGRKGRCPACKSLVEIKADDSSLATLLPAGSKAAARGAPGYDSTEVSGLIAALIGLGVTVALYAAIFFPIRSTYLGQLFVERGSVPYITAWVSCWGFALLGMKYICVKRQMAAAERELELIPLEIGLQITAENVDQFLGHLAALPPQQQGSILVRRIRGAIEHFKYRNSVPEVQGYLASQAEIDASGVDGGYTLLRSIVWAVPILGFIGTVVGISAAVQNLAEVMPRKEPGAAQSATVDGPEASLGAKLMGAMGSVTKNLAVAFDTTLVALALAIFLLFITESLRKTEYGMLDRIEQFANESLLRRMAEKASPASMGEAPQVVRDALDSAFREHQRWLAQWQAQVAELGRVIGADFEASAMNLQQRAADAERQRTDNIRSAVRMVEELFANLTGTATSLERSAHQATHEIGDSLAAAEKLQSALAENNRLLREVLEQERRLLEAAPAAGMPGLEAMLAGATRTSALAEDHDRAGIWQRIWNRKPPQA